jgi:hypothetical protein
VNGIERMRLTLKRAEEEDRRKLEEVKAELAERKQIRRFVKQRSALGLEYLKSLLLAHEDARSVTERSPTPATGKPPIKRRKTIRVPDYGPMTSKGRPRVRQWGMLRPAIRQVIERLDRITSVAVYEYLASNEFKFASPSRNQSVASIASYLRKLEVNGELHVVGDRGKGVHGVEFKKTSQWRSITSIAS